jgi:hypothetical protein
MKSSNNLESLPVFQIIELPCFIRDNQQALKCIGGLENAMKELVKSNPNICFRFPGENPLRSTLVATPKSKASLVLKVTRKKKKSTGEVISESVSIEGVVEKAFVFENPADYQVISSPFSSSVVKLF